MQPEQRSFEEWYEGLCAHWLDEVRRMAPAHAARLKESTKEYTP